MDNSDKLKQIHDTLIEYFKDVDDTTFVEFIDAFAYQNPTNSLAASKLAERFIKDNGLFDAIANENHDKQHPDQYFLRSSLSQRGMLQDIRITLVSLSHNRFRKALNNKKRKSSKNKKNFNLLKDELLRCYEALNRNWSYFNGEKEDLKFVKKITKLEYE